MIRHIIFAILMLAAALGIILLLIFGGIDLNEKIASAFTRENGNTKTFCLKKENCCFQDSDCRYAEFAGDCRPFKYIKRILKTAEKKNLDLPEITALIQVSCACVNNTCVNR